MCVSSSYATRNTSDGRSWRAAAAAVWHTWSFARAAHMVWAMGRLDSFSRIALSRRRARQSFVVADFEVLKRICNVTKFMISVGGTSSLMFKARPNRATSCWKLGIESCR